MFRTHTAVAATAAAAAAKLVGWAGFLAAWLAGWLPG